MSRVESSGYVVFFMSATLFLTILVTCSTRQAVAEKSDSITQLAKPNLLDEYFSQQFSSGDPGGAVLVMVKDSIFYLSAKDAENWAPIMKATKLNFEPGNRFEYSNPAFNALALIIEQVSKQKWQAFVTEKIMVPSGMKTSTITDGPHPTSGVAHGYIKVNGVW